MPTPRVEGVSLATGVPTSSAVAAAAKSVPHSAAHSVTAAGASPPLCMEDHLLKGLLGESGFAALRQVNAAEEDGDSFTGDFDIASPPFLRGGARSSTASTLYRPSMTSSSGTVCYEALSNTFAWFAGLPAVGFTA